MQKQMFEEARFLSTRTMAISRFPAVQGLALPRKGEIRAGFRAFGFVLLSACLFAACAPTYAPHIDAPAMPALDSAQRATRCAGAEKIAPLDPPPQLPDAEQTPCPRGSGLAACFTADQDAVRQQRFKILHDDRDYCRDAYNRAVKRVFQ